MPIALPACNWRSGVVWSGRNLYCLFGMRRKQHTLVVATDKSAFIVEASGTELREIGPRGSRESGQALVVVPDHWFRHEYFPFQSSKSRLIRTFLERKLKAAYPKSSFVSHFFTYSLRQADGGGRGIRVACLEEEKGFQLHESLCRTGLTPRWITTPALLWAEKLKRIDPDFAKRATLLVHSHPEQAYLYFFAGGDFLFSRRLAFPEGNPEALARKFRQFY